MEPGGIWGPTAEGWQLETGHGEAGGARRAGCEAGGEFEAQLQPCDGLRMEPNWLT